VATGRGPVTTGLGAEEVGIALEQGYVRVDELYRTSVPGISAVGDVITLGWARPPAARPRVVDGRHHLRRADRRAAGAPDQLRPRAGLHVLRPRDRQRRPHGGGGAREGLRRPGGDLPFGVLGRAKIANETEGLVKIVADEKYDEVLGVQHDRPALHRARRRGGDDAADGVAPSRRSSARIHAHPTMSEAVGEAAHAAHGAAIHV